MDWTFCSKQEILAILKSLIEKGYIKKKECFYEEVKSYEYYVIKGENYGTI